jgi:hypothetical protein
LQAKLTGQAITGGRILVYMFCVRQAVEHERKARQDRGPSADPPESTEFLEGNFHVGERRTCVVIT